MAAPSRSSIDEYQNLDARVRALAERINARFGKDGYQPIILKIEHHDAAQVYELMLELNREIGTALILVTHDPRLAARAGRTLELSGGTLQ